MEKEREDIKLEDLLLEVIDNKEVMEEAEGLLTQEQENIIKRLKNKEIGNEDRIRAYKNGLTMSEIARGTGYTRATISKYFKIVEDEYGTEEMDDMHKENREKLEYFKGWYLYVYKSDEVGDYHQMMKYLYPSRRRDGTAYNYYLEYGGDKLEQQEMDKRQVISKDKEQRVVGSLKEKPMEQVAFQERLMPESIIRIAEDNGVALVHEEDLTDDLDFTEKLNRWVKKREEYGNSKVKKGKEQEEEKENVVSLSE